ncbi:MAG: aldo/keto reductase [Lachnospiraceae bacterium]|nr:aldo/keto reductase [Lachnospiraceae bacterium]
MYKMLNQKVIPQCMIGTWAWGRGVNGSRMIFGKSYSGQELAATFRTAYEAGFTMWDTAEVYGMGNAEKIMGKCMARYDGVTLSTKHMPGIKYKAGAITKAVNGSLERLGIDAIDLYWLHKPFALRDNLREMIGLAKSGKIKSIGVSNCSLNQIKEAKAILEESGLKLAAVQNHYSLLCMEDDREVIPFCKENDILYFGYMILEQGALSGHYDPQHPFPAFSLRGISFGKKKFRKISRLIEWERKLAEKYEVDVSQIPIAWALAKQVVPIIGLTKPQHAQALEKGVQVGLLPQEIQKLESLARKSGVTCRGIWE